MKHGKNGNKYLNIEVYKQKRNRRGKKSPLQIIAGHLDEKTPARINFKEKILERKSSEFQSENIYAVSNEPLEQCEN